MASRYPKRDRKAPDYDESGPFDSPACGCVRSGGRRACVPRECAHLHERILCDGLVCDCAFAAEYRALKARGALLASGVDVVAALSGDHRGLKTRKGKPVGALLGIYDGARSTKQPSAGVLARGCTYRLRDGGWLTGTGKSGASAANHCCVPNAALQEWTVDAKGRSEVLLVAIKSIKAGQKITARYNYTGATSLPPCRCRPPRGHACCGLLGCSEAQHKQRLAKKVK